MKITGEWRKSSRSGPSGGCVEVRRMTDFIEVRDTKEGPGAPVQRYTLTEWVAFTDAVKADEFEV